MSALPVSPRSRTPFDLATEYWQANRLMLSRQKLGATGQFYSAPMCFVYSAAFDTAQDAKRALRLIQAAPELLRLLRTTSQGLGGVLNLELSSQDLGEMHSALADADALITHLTGD